MIRQSNAMLDFGWLSKVVVYLNDMSPKGKLNGFQQN
jgi:hypothetical protein